MQNLIDNRDVTAALLANPLQWRVRVVEEVSVDAATHCTRSRSLQCAPLQSILEPFLESDEGEALLALNVASVPRGPLLDFDVEAPSGQAWLMPRTEIAARQALYLTNTAAACGYPMNQDQIALVTAVLAFTGNRWFVERKQIPFADYMRDGLGADASDDQIEAWREIGDSCRAILRPRLDNFRGYSAPENPALALPSLFADIGQYNGDAANRYLEQYLDLLESLDARADSGGADAFLASEFLDVLADYGNYFDLIVAMKVPINEPFLLKYSERRALKLGPFLNQGHQELIINDAVTNHVTFTLSDPNVRIANFEARKPADDEAADGSFLSRSDGQTRSLYAYDTDRDYRIRLVFRLALLRRLQMIPYFAAVLAMGLCALLVWEAPEDIRTLAIVLAPAALAVSVIVARESSTLGSRLRLLSTAVLGTALIALVVTAGVTYVCGKLQSADESITTESHTPQGN
jgi:hypothetical protein